MSSVVATWLRQYLISTALPGEEILKHACIIEGAVSVAYSVPP